jgi:spermidine/putrescine-binding protein
MAFAAAAAIVVAACGGDDAADEPAEDTSETAGPAEEGVQCEVGQTDGDLYLYNWSEYIDPELKDAFAAEYGVEVFEDNYDSNEAMQPIIAAGGSGYDVTVPSDYMVSIMIEEGSLMKLDLGAIPNIANLAGEFYPPPYDPTGEYVAAYQWGTTGFGVNLTVMGEDTPRSWALVFDPEIAANFDGRITLLNDPRETLGAALKYLGYSLNTTDDAELAEAEALVAEAVGRIAAFDSDQYDELLVAGQTDLAHGFSGNVMVGIADAENPDDYVYFVPEEGGTIWTDNMAIPFDAPHPCTAHTFINFMLDAENGAQLSEWNYYASPNAASEEFLDPEFLADESVYPTDRSKLEFITNTGDFETNFSDAFSRAKG